MLRTSPSMSVVTDEIGVPKLFAPVIKCKSSTPMNVTGWSTELAFNVGFEVCHADNVLFAPAQ